MIAKDPQRTCTPAGRAAAAMAELLMRASANVATPEVDVGKIRSRSWWTTPTSRACR